MNPVDVSVIVVTYNRAHTLRECIDSILMQTHPSLQILVVDDGSTDGTAPLVRSYGEKIQYHQREHQGLSLSGNAAASLARGEWIAFLDSDDFYLTPDVVRDYLGVFREEPALDVVASGWKRVDPEGRPLKEVEPWKDAPALDLEAFLYWKPAFPSAKMFRRESFLKFGGYDPAFESAMDTDLFLRMLLRGARIGWLHKITCGLRQSPDSMLQNAPRQSRFLLQALDRAFSSPDFPENLKPKEAGIRYATHLWLAWNLWSRGFSEEASAAMRDARRCRRERLFNQLDQWRRKFDEHSERAGSRKIPEAEFLSLALPAFSLSDPGRKQTALLMDWWWNIWSGYVEGAAGEAPPYPDRVIPPVAQLVELTKRCIHLGKEPAPLAPVDRFWTDALRRGWVGPDEREAVITLHLACFTRSVFARKPQAAARSLARALAATRSRKALAPWRRFFSAAVRHYLLGSRPEDEETA